MENYHISEKREGFASEEIEEILIRYFDGKDLKKVLFVIPDHTRYHSNAGYIANTLYHHFTKQGVHVDLLEALGTHEKMSEEEVSYMYGDIPYASFIPHDWRNDVVKIGEVPASFIEEVSEGLWKESLDVEVNKLILDPSYDLVLSIGQVVPHEVIGMSNHSKNLFVGTGGSNMINSSHMIGAVYGMERMMGRDFTPVRKIFDYALEHYLKDIPLTFILTVTTGMGTTINTHGLFIGRERKCLEEAVKLSQEKNVNWLDTGIKKCVVYLDPKEFKSTWLGNKAVYRTRMAMADGGELIILGQGVCRFGEDKRVDELIRKYGYTGRLHILEKLNEEDDLKANMSAAAHLIHGSSDGRFSITYAVENISKEEIESVGYKAADYGAMVKKYDIGALEYGYNTVDGEEVFYIPNPALGLWIDKERFEG